MRLQVRPEPSRLGERPPTVLTLVWFLPSVEPLVAPQRRGLAECPETVLALVRPLTGMDSSMGSQTPLRAEHPLALLALPPRPVLRLGEHPIEEVGLAGSLGGPGRLPGALPQLLFGACWDSWGHCAQRVPVGWRPCSAGCWDWGIDDTEPWPSHYGWF